MAPSHLWPSTVRRVLVTGGGGYVGSLLVPMLLRHRYSVRVLDSFMYGQTALLEHTADPQLEVVRGDIRDASAVYGAFENMDAVIHLAAIVGVSACHRDSDASAAVNVTGVKTVVAAAEAHDVPILFPSTGSCYEAVPSGVGTEETPIASLSEYGAQKAQAEDIIQNARVPWLIYRLATVFGASPRPRLDLLINDFAYQAVMRKSLVVYELGVRRTFLHVRDAARAFLLPLELGRNEWGAFMNRVYNVGNSAMNLTKAEIARSIVTRVPDCSLNLVGDSKNAEVYEVDCSKIERSGFRCVIDFEAGLDDVFKSMQIIRIANPYSNAG